ncbi:MAG: PRC and DUF2382 domain-containing protein [Actinomycetota bacterium]|nr:PRC and DUF2382 domain-containing protein [Actinomycetota bacterium]
MTRDSNFAQDLMGRNVVDSTGSKIGKVAQVYLDDQSGEPEWVTVSTGLLGTKQSFVPLREADYSGDDVVVRVEKDVVKDAPKIDDDGHLDPAEEEELYRYYDDKLGSGYGSEQTTNRADSRLENDDHSGDTGEAGTGHMTRSEEQVRVGTERRETGRARLRKYVVTENVTKTVPVSREEVRVEREPIAEGDREKVRGGTDISEDEHEVTLHAEEPVVEKKTVPVERVKLGKEKVTDEEQVEETVRKEQVDFEDNTDGPKRKN